MISSPCDAAAEIDRAIGADERRRGGHAAGDPHAPLRRHRDHAVVARRGDVQRGPAAQIDAADRREGRQIGDGQGRPASLVFDFRRAQSRKQHVPESERDGPTWLCQVRGGVQGQRAVRQQIRRRTRKVDALRIGLQFDIAVRRSGERRAHGPDRGSGGGQAVNRQSARRLRPDEGAMHGRPQPDRRPAQAGLLQAGLPHVGLHHVGLPRVGSSHVGSRHHRGRRRGQRQVRRPVPRVDGAVQAGAQRPGRDRRFRGQRAHRTVGRRRDADRPEVRQIGQTGEQPFRPLDDRQRGMQACPIHRHLSDIVIRNGVLRRGAVSGRQGGDGQMRLPRIGRGESARTGHGQRQRPARQRGCDVQAADAKVRQRDAQRGQARPAGGLAGRCDRQPCQRDTAGVQRVDQDLGGDQAPRRPVQGRVADRQPDALAVGDLQPRDPQSVGKPAGEAFDPHRPAAQRGGQRLDRMPARRGVGADQDDRGQQQRRAGQNRHQPGDAAHDPVHGHPPTPLHTQGTGSRGIGARRIRTPVRSRYTPRTNRLPVRGSPARPNPAG